MNPSYSEYEPVHRIWDYFDQPRSGVADFHGRVHWFECIFDKDRDVYSDDYWLTPLDERLVEVERQSWESFIRRRQSFSGGAVDSLTRSALLEEKGTFENLKTELRRAGASPPANQLKAHGTFRIMNPPMRSLASASFEVAWNQIEE